MTRGAWPVPGSASSDAAPGRAVPAATTGPAPPPARPLGAGAAANGAITTEHQADCDRNTLGVVGIHADV